jgi:hypothetical protein
VKRLLIALSLTLAIHPVSAAAAPDDASPEPAARLAAALEMRKLTAFAASDPGAPGRFVAVLFFSGVQMLTIAGTYPAPGLLEQLIASGNHRQVYVDLSTAAAREGRLFVEDFGAAGLRPTRDGDELFDRVWRDTTRGVRYDGDPKAQNLSEAEYRSRFSADDAEYARVLQVMIEAMRDSADGGPPAGGNPP